MSESHGYIPGPAPRVLALSGRKGSGKDEAAKALLADGWVRVALADPVREMLTILNPIIVSNFGEDSRWRQILEEDGYDQLKQYPEARRLMQVFATEVIRNNFGQDAWLDLAVTKIEDLTSDGFSVVVTDCRFPNEARKIRQVLRGMVVNIIRPELPADDAHLSEQPLPVELLDHTIINNGTIADLHRNIREAASRVRPL